MQKTVKVRIAVAFSSNGKWEASGSNTNSDYEERCYASMMCARKNLSDLKGITMYWVTAELPIPDVQEIKGVVEEE